MKKFIAILLVALLAVGVAFAGGEQETATTTKAAANKGPVEIKVGTSLGWDTLSPFRSNIGNNMTVWSTCIFECLGWLNADNQLVPWGAKSWSTTDNGVTYTIELYDYITDSQGNNIKASDVAWFLGVAKQKALKPNFKYIESATAVGEYTLEVKFNNAMVGVFETFMTDTFLVSQAAYEAQGDDFVNSCVSTSAYKVTSFTSGSVAVLEKRADYWQKAELLDPVLKANVDRVELHTIPEAAQLGIALETGVVDFACQFNASTAVQFADDPDFTLQRGQGRNGMQIFFSGADEKAVANDKYLRQAICYALDNELMISAVLEGFGDVMHDSAATYAMGYQKSWLDEEYYPYSVEKAKECLAKSNYQGQELELLANSTMKTLAEIIQNCCAAIGVKVKLNIVQTALLTSIRLDGTKYDMFINQVGGITLANHWNTRYDARAYKTGDATSRHDYVLADLIKEASSVEGFTAENINKVHNYIKDEAYGYGMYQPQILTVWRNDVGMTKVVNDYISCAIPTACEY